MRLCSRLAISTAVFVACVFVPIPSHSANVDPNAFLADLDPMINIKSYRAEAVSNGKGSPFKMRMEYVAPNQFHIINHVGAGNFETITSKDGSYYKANGKWTKAPFTSNPANTRTGPEQIKQWLRRGTISFVGVQGLAGVPMKVYDYRSPSANGLPDSMLRLWVGADHFIHQMVIDSGKKTAMTIKYFDFNAPISIKAPI